MAVRRPVRSPYGSPLLMTAVNNSVMFCWEALFPLFAFTSKELGGLGLDVSCLMRSSELSRYES